MKIGVAFTVEGQWFVELDGQRYALLGGELGEFHPNLMRGRDENKRVIVDYVLNGWCHIRGREENTK